VLVLIEFQVQLAGFQQTAEHDAPLSPMLFARIGMVRHRIVTHHLLRHGKSAASWIVAQRLLRRGDGVTAQRP
jgi:hypothetical protein